VQLELIAGRSAMFSPLGAEVVSMSHRKTRPAPTGRRCDRIFNPERGPDQVVDKIDLGPRHVLHGHRVDQHSGAVAGEHEVVVSLGRDESNLYWNPEQPPPATLTRSIEPGGSDLRIS
jgi:hypothetical protein